VQAYVTVQDDIVTVKVTNPSAGAILDGMVVFGSGRGIQVGRVEPGQTRTFEAPPRPIRAWKQIAATVTRRRARSLNPTDIFTLAGTRGRSQGISDYLDDGAAVVCVQFENEPTPFTVKNKGTCKYHHVQFARLVVFPE
jgi:hypothetical protein